MNACTNRCSSPNRATGEPSCLWPAPAVLPCSRPPPPRISRQLNTSPIEYSIRSCGRVESDSDLAEQVDQPPRTCRQGRVVGLELNRDSFQPVRERSVRRGPQFGGLVDQAIDVLHHVAQRFPGLWILSKRLGQFPMQLGDEIA